MQQRALTCLTEDLGGYIRGCATDSEDWFSHNHGKTKVCQLQPTEASSHMLNLRESKKKQTIKSNVSRGNHRPSSLIRTDMFSTGDSLVNKMISLAPLFVAI